MNIQLQKQGTISKSSFSDSKNTIVLLVLSMVIICAMTSSAITAIKPVDIIVSFPFSNMIFSFFTFPIIDGICELYGKRLAYLISTLGIISQLIFVILIDLSIVAPATSQWKMRTIYTNVLSKNNLVILGTICGFLSAQFLDINIFQKIRKFTKGKYLWLRSSVSSILGQTVDSIIFITIVFWSYPNKEKLILGSVMSKSLFCLFAIPITYIVVYSIKKYLLK